MGLTEDTGDGSLKIKTKGGGPGRSKRRATLNASDNGRHGVVGQNKTLKIREDRRRKGSTAGSEGWRRGNGKERRNEGVIASERRESQKEGND